MAKKSSVIEVQGSLIRISNINDEDYISLTDMYKSFGDEAMLYNWLRNRNTVEFLGIWETIHNPDFKPVEFDRFKTEAGLNSFKLSPQKWVEATNAIGIQSKSGRYGGTYAHRDIAFEFGAWLSPEFKLYLIKEFQRLKQDEAKRISEGWDYRRFLSKVNYRIHTDSVKENLIPKMNISKNQEWLVYAEEADLLNMALFNETAKDWRERNPEKDKVGENIRDSATVVQLTVLSNLENLNAIMIAENIPKETRFSKLQVAAITQMKSLLSLKRTSPDKPKELE
jgi:hypothetical protein